ncbi:hypothetical protein NFI96_007342 [Prochilodus magdalenae]|nr:hypothetical protein NFI96_007342 [Prochilodus magdalenae]
MILSKHFITTNVKATGRKSFKQAGCDFFGTGTMTDYLKHAGTMPWLRDELKISMNTGASWSAQALMTRPAILSGDAAFLAFNLLKALRTSLSLMVRGLCVSMSCVSMLVTLVALLASLALLPAAGETSAQTIDPLVGEVQIPEGDDLTLSCNYTTGSYTSATLFWYRQSPGSSPEFLLRIVSGSKAESSGRLKAEVDVKNKRVDLKISSAAVSDSVLYYCALTPTVTGNPDTLYRNWFYD